ncbi:MAG: hypothetical protein GF353_28685 [Candidatus Lokiarchaeota archaeon]|nr:hypothetical protein [Candidatus Lokiarchaeota archaeon]MBD3353979.1 hypothetical protein [Candidatus Lokiarchaeota archaeon]
MNYPNRTNKRKKRWNDPWTVEVGHAKKSNPNLDRNDPNKKDIEEYIRSFPSKKTQYNERRRLRYAFDFLYQANGKLYILDYKVEDLDKYKKYIQSLDLTQNSKRRRWNTLFHLIQFINRNYRKKGKNYNTIDYSLVFNDINFTDDGFHRVPIYLNEKQISEILQDALHKSPWYHYILLKLFLSTCRQGGAASLTFNNINFTVGYFDLYEKGSKGQKNRHGKQINRYFHTKEYFDELAAYCKFNGIKDDELIFGITPKQMQFICHRYTEATLHDFRRSIKRLWKENQMDIVDRRTLSSHKQDTDGIYSSLDPIQEPEKCQKLFERYYHKIFKYTSLIKP